MRSVETGGVWRVDGIMLCVEELGKRRRHAHVAMPAAAATAAAAAHVEAFVPCAQFEGARAGCVFKLGDKGLGYYRDGAAPEEEETPLPPGWVQGVSPEGYTYYWHTPTSTSSWERPTHEPPSRKCVQVEKQVASALLASRKQALNKIQQDAGAQLMLHSTTAATTTVVITGPAAAVARAETLLQRKADAVRFTSRTRAVAPPPQLAQAAATPDYNFHAVAPFVEARSIAPQMESEPAGDALAALAAYDDDEEEG
mmetsp:Transcript_3006/g.6238  ORF Transcript_3006/g.6238 Transcript_3006/m.6238 type:complete len:255 (-) Transcript_3006:128-892(-)